VISPGGPEEGGVAAEGRSTEFRSIRTCYLLDDENFGFNLIGLRLSRFRVLRFRRTRIKELEADIRIFREREQITGLTG
jgi:hypothetical protein